MASNSRIRPSVQNICTVFRNVDFDKLMDFYEEHPEAMIKLYMDVVNDPVYFEVIIDRDGITRMIEHSYLRD